jgi:DNA-binding response OmpR family regulator
MSQEPHPTSSPDVLVIDDHLSLRTFTRLVLTQAGYRVREAADGAAGLRAFAERPADLVLCDLCLPDADGLEAVRELRRAAPGVPVIAVSGGGSGRRLDFLWAAGGLGAATLPKPFTAAELLAAVAAGLAQAAARLPQGVG